MSAYPLRVMVVDDDVTVRGLLRKVIAGSDGFQLVAEASDGQEALVTAKEIEPQIVLTDIQMPEMDGVKLTCELLQLFPDIKVIALTGASSSQRLKEMVANGAAGYLMKTAGPAEILRALTSVAQGHSVLSPEITSLVLRDLVALYREERLKAESLAELDSMKRNFVAVVSHELRTPVAVIKAGVSTLQRHTEGIDGSAEQFLDVIARQCTRLERMVSQVLTVSQLENGSGQNLLRSVRVDEVVAQAIRSLPAGQSGRLEIDVGSEDVVGDMDQLAECLLWVIENALTFSEGRIEVLSRMIDNHQVDLSVTDRGVGMEDALIRRILDEPFTQKDASTTRTHGGLGLSLFAARQVLRSASGSLTIESKAGRGTRVTFHLRSAAMPSAGLKDPQRSGLAPLRT